MPTRRAKPITKPRRARKASLAAIKGWETRRKREAAEERARAARARKAAATRARKRAEAEELLRKRAEASRKGWAKRRAEAEKKAQAKARRKTRRDANKRAKDALDLLLRSAKQEKERPGWEPVDDETYSELHDDWLDAKDELWSAAYDEPDYYSILDDIADETGCDWDIAYGPEGK